jgi:hypothetical protein
MKLYKFAVLGGALLTAACGSGEMSWQRLDGRPLHPHQFKHAMYECRERAWVGYEPSMDRMKHCMAHKGYVWAEVTNHYGGYY